LISKSQSILENKIGGLLNESYTRAYSDVLKLQILYELEEITTYKCKYSDSKESEAMDVRL